MLDETCYHEIDMWAINVIDIWSRETHRFTKLFSGYTNIFSTNSIKKCEYCNTEPVITLINFPYNSSNRTTGLPTKCSSIALGVINGDDKGALAMFSVSPKRLRYICIN